MGADTRLFHYDLEGNLVGEFEAGLLLRVYVYADGERVAAVSLDPGPKGLFFLHNDHLGTPKAVTNKNAKVVWSASHTPFGTARISVEKGENNFRFPGQYFDEETGLNYNYQRTYDPGIGRYTTADPIGFASGINLYAYVDSNPLNFVDPEGLVKRDPNTTFRSCESADWDVCRTRCGRRGVLRCRVQVTKKLRRLIVKGDVTIERLHFDETVLCECGDNEAAISCGTACKIGIFTAIGLLCLTPIPGDEAAAIGLAGAAGIFAAQQ